MKPCNQYYPNQWALKNTGQNGGKSGIDIEAEGAWSITRGNNSIRVAVIDEGINLTHPDLQANLLPGFDATANAPGGTNGSSFGTNAHGTACAGIIGAIDNTIGIIGVAPYIRIIPIRIAYVANGSTNWTTDDTWIANGINHAWQTAQADVLSNSWGGPWEPLTDAAINNAVTNGRLRNGVTLGCVVVAASGNGINGIGTTTVQHPASRPDVIAVGAIDNKGSRAAFSDYGTNLNVVAPGVGIYTTGILGATGYETLIYSIINNGANGVYFSNFTGTSASCPQVAGIAALILSVRPDLSQAQVRQAIESTCTKLSGYSYSSNSAHPNGTWNNEVGHGLVNAYKAVYSITPSISGPDCACETPSSTYTLSNVPANSSVSWSVSPSLQIVSSSVNSAAVKKYSSSDTDLYGWIKATVSIPGNSPITLQKKVLVWRSGIQNSTVASATLKSGYTPYGKPYGGETNSRYGGEFALCDPVGGSPLLASNFNWSTTAPWEATNSQGVYFMFFEGREYCGQFSTTVNFKDACGGNSTICQSYEIDCYYSYVKAYPNPASDILNIEMNEETIDAVRTQAAVQNKTFSPTFDIRLYDELGTMQRSAVTKGNKVEFNVENLPNGFYYLHIYDGMNDKPEKQQIVVKH